MQSLDILVKDRISHSYEGYTAKQVVKELEKKKISYQIYYLSDGILQDYLQHVKIDPPKCILTFVDLFFHNSPLCDIIGVPQFFWTMNSISEAASLLHSKLGKIGFCSPISLHNTLYLPHGVGDITPSVRVFNAVFFASLVDPNYLKKMWKKFFPDVLFKAVMEAIESNLPPLEAALSIWNKNIHLSSLICAIEKYRKAEMTYARVFSFDEELDLFGEHEGNNLLKKVPKRIHLHMTLPYTERLKVVQQSKKIIIDPLEPHWYIQASHCGCEVIDGIPYQVNVGSWEERVKELCEFIL